MVAVNPSGADNNDLHINKKKVKVNVPETREQIHKEVKIDKNKPSVWNENSDYKVKADNITEWLRYLDALDGDESDGITEQNWDEFVAKPFGFSKKMESYLRTSGNIPRELAEFAIYDQTQNENSKIALEIKNKGDIESKAGAKEYMQILEDDFKSLEDIVMKRLNPSFMIADKNGNRNPDYNAYEKYMSDHGYTFENYAKLTTEERVKIWYYETSQSKPDMGV